MRLDNTRAMGLKVKCLAFALLVTLVQTEDNCISDNAFEYIVVGTGSTGSVVATRLSEDAASRVLVLEAGGEPLPFSEIPLLAMKALATEMDWNYTTVRQEECCYNFINRSVPWNRGKVLGGTSSINFMVYTRGNKRDYDSWAEQGNPGWSFDAVLPYFHKLEDYRIPTSRHDAKYHSEGGPMSVEYPSFKTPLADTFLQAGHELGYPLVDYNAEFRTGFMYPPVNIKDGARCSTYTGYLKPALNRPNLHLEVNALVTKILFDDKKRATGVIYEQNGRKCKAVAKREVILSGGVINSPQLLMLSGVGPKETLKNFGIPVVKNAPGVGQNLQDHVTVGGLEYYVDQPVTYKLLKYDTAEHEEKWKSTKTGPLTTPGGFEGVAFFNSRYTNDTQWPDLEIYYSSDNLIRGFKPYINSLLHPLLPSDEHDLITFIPILLRPKSRGFLTLQSEDPRVPPLIDPKYLSNDEDTEVLVDALFFINKISETKAFKKYGPQQINKGILPSCLLHYLDTHQYYKCLVKTLTSTAYHPTSTCKMGPKTDPMAVVDNRLRVYGVKNLRVADASIMPNVIAAHPSVPCVMIGEKVSDMIKADWAPPPPPDRPSSGGCPYGHGEF